MLNFSEIPAQLLKFYDNVRNFPSSLFDLIFPPNREMPKLHSSQSRAAASRRGCERIDPFTQTSRLTDAVA